MKQDVILDLQGISKSFFTEDVETRALDEINLSILKGDYTAMVGPSGSGKSTLLSIMGLLDTATSGRYLLSDIDVTGMTRNQQAKVRNEHIGFIFQSFNLISELTVEDNILVPLSYSQGLSKNECRDRIDEVLEKVNMQHRKKHYPSQLSGGQQQRVAIARALVGKPSLILADEPTGNLDSENAQAILDLLKSLNEDGATICMVTHDPRSMADANRCIKIRDGAIES